MEKNSLADFVTNKERIENPCEKGIIKIASDIIVSCFVILILLNSVFIILENTNVISTTSC